MDFLPKIVYQDNDLILSRKPHWIASSWGKEECFLDIIKKNKHCDSLWWQQISIFWEEWEYGLLNRLDNVTSGLLYFAKSYESKAEYMHIQEKWLIIKTYYAKVFGTLRASFWMITTPIYHHRDDQTRMTTDSEKWRWNAQRVTTCREKIPNSELIKITINSGCRHQIRCHLASIWHPIVWDKLYMTKWLKKNYGSLLSDDKIELISAGLYL